MKTRAHRPARHLQHSRTRPGSGAQHARIGARLRAVDGEVRAAGGRVSACPHAFAYAKRSHCSSRACCSFTLSDQFHSRRPPPCPNRAPACSCRSLIKGSGELELSLATVDVPDRARRDPGRASRARRSTPRTWACCWARLTSPPPRPRTGPSPPPAATLPAGADRAPRPVHAGGNEGAGRGDRRGVRPGPRALMGRTVAHLGGGHVPQYRHRKAAAPAAAGRPTPADGASCFVNPLTALGMVETMRREGQQGLVHTAGGLQPRPDASTRSASRRVDLVNIVRTPAQAKILTTSARSTSSTPARELPGRADRTPWLRRRHHRLRRHRGRQLAGQILPPWRSRPTARRPPTSRYGLIPTSRSTSTAASTPPDRVQPRLRHGLRDRRLLRPTSHEDRPGRGPEAARTGRQRAQDHLRSHYTAEIGLAEALKTGHESRAYNAQDHRREVPDQTDKASDGLTSQSRDG